MIGNTHCEIFQFDLYCSENDSYAEFRNMSKLNFAKIQKSVKRLKAFQLFILAN